MAVTRHFRRPVELPFTRAERDRVRCLFGGLTDRHGDLILAAMAGLGYRGVRLPTPTKADFQTGREFGNPGMCNPAYFTAGALINYLRRLRDAEGLSVARICRDYVFATAGSCGPCRFGMYESEYRLALRNSGFDGFRVLIFQEKGGLNQSGADAGLAFNAEFAEALVTALLIGDLLNDLANQIRPYEVRPGQTDCTFAKAVARMGDALRLRERCGRRFRWPARVMAKLISAGDAEGVQFLLNRVFSTHLLHALAECAAMIDREIVVDYTRPKPVCKIVGEAWAQMTEGDGNFHMFCFLESEGAEIIMEPMLTWAGYLLDSGVRKLVQKRRAEVSSSRSDASGMGRRAASLSAHSKRILLLKLASWLVNREYERMRIALRGVPHPGVDQGEIRRLAEPFFNGQITGGEGHLEVGKTLYYSLHGLSHMVLSLKPFGCLPSTQSDGAQAAVLGRHPEIVFLPIETSGEGDLGACSRVQMALGEAKTRCKQEFEDCLRRTGHSMEAIRGYCREHQDLRRPLQAIPRIEGVAGRAASFVVHVAGRMASDTGWPCQPTPGR